MSDSEIFRDKENDYEYIQLDKLKRDYVAIQVECTPSKQSTIGNGRTYLFWVASNGAVTFVYRSSGNAEILRNSEFRFISVVDVYNACKAYKSMVVNGRIMYLLDNECGTEWSDVGPISCEGVSPDDTPFDEVVDTYRNADVQAAKKVQDMPDIDFLATGRSFGENW